MLLTIDQAKTKLQVSRSTVYRLIASDQLKSKTIGQRRMILEADLNSFWENCPASPLKGAY